MISKKETFTTPLSTMEVGSSFFYPAYDEALAEQRLRRKAARAGVTVTVVRGIERGMYGLRVIRIG